MMKDKNKIIKTQCEKAIEMLEEDYGAEFFKDEKNNVYVKVYLNEHMNLLSVNSDSFKTFLNGVFFMKYNRGLNRDVFNQIIDIVSFSPLFEMSKSDKLFNRIGYDEEDSFYYDLSNWNGEVVKIANGYWEVGSYYPVNFKRFNHQLPQLIPEENNANIKNCAKIFDYLNISKSDRQLFLVWLISCFIPNIPHPILILNGEMGTAKTTTFTFLKKLIDPSVAETLAIEKDMRDLSVIFENHWFVPLDNISSINTETSDCLCRAVTGAATQKRKLHTNGEDYIFKYQKCIGINGISQVANKPDLIDRSIIIEMEPIKPEERKELTQLTKEFESDIPIILAGVFETLSKAKEIFNTVEIKSFERMADFEKWGYTISRVLDGVEFTDNFIREYHQRIKKQKRDLLFNDVVALTLLSYLKNKAEFHGTMTLLLANLKEEAEAIGIDTRGNQFPKYPNKLSMRINEIQRNLVEEGISIDKSRNGEKREIHIINQNFKTISVPMVNIPMIRKEEKNETDNNPNFI
ncbi:MAG: hypothetical protein IJJ41_02005 [Clostridia bacterium]|nr:hypothetical protein [Clostridia bacterium]